MEELIDSVYNNPEDWTISRFEFQHKPSGFTVWTNLGFLGCNVTSSSLRMNYSQKWRIWKAFKWWCSNAPITAVK